MVVPRIKESRGNLGAAAVRLFLMEEGAHGGPPPHLAVNFPLAEAETAFDGFQASHVTPPSKFFQNSATLCTRHPVSGPSSDSIEIQ